jgi:hypothetical protein
MAKKKEMLDEILQIPVTKSMKREIESIADAEERRLTDVGRMLWREALRARREAEQVSGNEQAAVSAVR